MNPSMDAARSPTHFHAFDAGSDDLVSHLQAATDDEAKDEGDRAEERAVHGVMGWGLGQPNVTLTSWDTGRAGKRNLRKEVQAPEDRKRQGAAGRGTQDTSMLMLSIP